MKIKVYPWNRELVQQSMTSFSLIVGLGSGVLTFVDLNATHRLRIFIVLIILFVLIFLVRLYLVNTMDHVKLTSGSSTVEIKEGNILSDEYFHDHDAIKVFSFNEYFDTQVDDEIISRRTLNGKVLAHLDEIDDHVSLDARMSVDPHLLEMRIGKNSEREKGKTTKYHLGTIFKYSDDIYFTALSHFDKSNRANLTIQDFIRFLVNFWDEIDNFYAQRTVVITLFGSGITRLENNTFTNQQILQIILWTFQLRRIKFKKPAKFVILLDPSTNKNINYFKVRRDFSGLPK